MVFLGTSDGAVMTENTITVKPQPVHIDSPKAKIQDLTLQPKQTDEERAKRFESLTNYKED
jgi:hypothetical protein